MPSDRALAMWAYLMTLAALFVLGVAIGRSVAARETACIRACDGDYRWAQ